MPKTISGGEELVFANTPSGGGGEGATGGRVNSLILVIQIELQRTFSSCKKESNQGSMHFIKNTASVT